LHSSSATDRPGFLAGNRIQLSGVGSSPSGRAERKEEDGDDGDGATLTTVPRVFAFHLYIHTYTHSGIPVTRQLSMISSPQRSDYASIIIVTAR